MRVGLSTTAICGDLGGYFFGNFRDRSMNIIWRYTTPCQSVIDCKMNDLKLGFRIVLDSEGSTFKDNCAKSNKHRPILSAAEI